MISSAALNVRGELSTDPLIFLFFLFKLVKG